MSPARKRRGRQTVSNHISKTHRRVASSKLPLSGCDFCAILTSKLLVVTWRGPLALLDHLVDGAADLGTSSHHVVHGELVKGTGVLDVLQGGLEVLEFSLDLGRGSLGLLDLLGVFFPVEQKMREHVSNQDRRWMTRRR